MRRTLLFQTTFSLLLAWNVSAAQPADEEDDGGKLVIDLAYGWTATRGNDVQVGNRTSVSPRGLFDEDTTFEPLITKMENEFMPFARVGYEGRTWGLQGELWMLETRGSLVGSFDNTEGARDELVHMWEAWFGEDNDRTRYDARNDLSLYSIRVDLTRALARNVLLTVGAHVAKVENQRVENVQIEDRITFPDFFFVRGSSMTVERTAEGRSRVRGWLIGPSVGLRGTGFTGSLVEVGYAFAQSLLFTDLDHEASWTGRTSIPREPLVRFDTALTTRAAVPVTDLRGALTANLGSHVSFGVFGFLSVWYDVPMARELSVLLEQWTEPRRTLVVASFGPIVKLRF
jgi:hypothetical protein